MTIAVDETIGEGETIARVTGAVTAPETTGAETETPAPEEGTIPAPPVLLTWPPAPWTPMVRMTGKNPTPRGTRASPKKGRAQQGGRKPAERGRSYDVESSISGNLSVEDRLAYYKKKYGDDFKPTDEMLKSEKTKKAIFGKKERQEACRSEAFRREAEQPEPFWRQGKRFPAPG